MIEIGTLCRLDPIACEMLPSSFLGGSTEPRLKISRRKLVIIGADLWAIGGLCLYHSSTPTPFDFIVAFPMVALGCGAFTLATIGAGSWMYNSAAHLSRTDFLRTIRLPRSGDSDDLARLATAPRWLRWMVCPALSLAATIVVSAISYRWFETPFLRLKLKIRPCAVRGRGGLRQKPRAQRRDHGNRQRNRSVEFRRLSGCARARARGAAAHGRLPGRERRTLRRQVSTIPEFRRSCRRYAMRCSRQPASGWASFRSRSIR
jgi:hypothetical protein